MQDTPNRMIDNLARRFGRNCADREIVNHPHSRASDEAAREVAQTRDHVGRDWRKNGNDVIPDNRTVALKREAGSGRASGVCGAGSWHRAGR